MAWRMTVLPSVMLHWGGLCPIKLCSLWGPHPHHRWCWGEDAPEKIKKKIMTCVSLVCQSYWAPDVFCVTIAADVFESNAIYPICPVPHTYNADVPKLVSRGHGIVVKQTGRGHPAGICVISKDDELVLVAPVTNPEQALLNIRHDHTLADGIDAGHQVGNVLKRRAIKYTQ